MKTTTMQFLFLLAAFTVANAGDATCLAGTGGSAETNENCTARGITEALCQTEGDATVCQWTAANCDTGDACTESVDTDGVCGAATNAADGTTCDDGNENTTDVCASGVCESTAMACEALANGAFTG